MRAWLLCLFGAVACAGMAMTQGCSTTSAASSVDAGVDAGEVAPMPACPAATDAGVAASADAGVTSKVLSPTNGQKFTSNEKVPVHGVGFDPKEGSIVDRTRTIWYVGSAVMGPSPDGESPDDNLGPFPVGTYVVRFDVSNKACVTAADSVMITVE